MRVWGVGLRKQGITFIFSMLADTPGFPPGNTTPEPWKRFQKVNQPCTAAVFKSQQRSQEGGVPREHTMLKRHLPRVINH